MNSYLERISNEEVKKLPLKQFEGTINVIESKKSLDKVLNEIVDEDYLGFDTETKPSFKKNIKNKVALLQLSTSNTSYLIRLNKTGFTKKLANLLSNENIKKIGVALNDDIKGLQQLYNFKPNGFIDLQTFVKDYGIINNGLKNLTAIVLKFRISKAQQTSNWENEILTESQIKYAATDAWVCHEIYKELTNHKNITS